MTIQNVKPKINNMNKHKTFAMIFFTAIFIDAVIFLSIFF